MYPFDPHAWAYKADGPDAHLRRAAAMEPISDVGNMARILNFSGGKAFGLAMCVRLSARSDRLRVPPWIALPAPRADPRADVRQPVVTDWTETHPGPWIARSSLPEEDWIDGGSGTNSSLTVNAGDNPMTAVQSVSESEWPVVLQRFMSGVGMVVDIGFSPVLGRPVARVSTGRADDYQHGQVLYTNATRDHDGLHELLDPQTGERLAEPSPGIMVTPEITGLPYADLVRELWQRCARLGINFGVQFEVIIHPKQPYEWNLVQIRPSPAQVRCHPLRPRPLEGAVHTTPCVNGAFRFNGAVRLATKEFRRHAMRATLGDPELIAMLQWHARRAKAVAWGQFPDGYAAACINAATAAGATVHLTRGVLAINTMHGMVSQEDVANASVDPRARTIALSEDTFDALEQRLKHEPVRVRVESDGLVGQLAID